ncbi:MAG TPA: site-specific DNA-methyltransferase [Sedimentisphaerales bacterium]|nr:site-specific DNA-methyltransferase [Sedimentisphaerales bacterium]
MEIVYKNKRPIQQILQEVQAAEFERDYIQGAARKNKLIKGDNLQIMKALLHDYDMAGTVDLVYIDPPFSTNNVFRHNEIRTATISRGNNDTIAYSDTLVGREFLEFLRERLVFIRELMSFNASIYLHIDYKVGHYVKVIMDEIFGLRNFRNDITRIKCNPKNFPRKGYSNIKDLILFYTKTHEFTWNEPREKMSDEDIKRLFQKIDKAGRRYTTTPLHAPGETATGNTGKEWRGLMPPKGRHWRYDPSALDQLDEAGLIEWSNTGNPRKIIYAAEAREKGKRLQDIWEYKDPIYPSYPTQKNSKLLRRIIETSSESGQIVMDCFCGSGTTLVVAEDLGRNWIGIDNSDVAIKTTIKRLGSPGGLFNTGASYEYLEQIPSVRQEAWVEKAL